MPVGFMNMCTEAIRMLSIAAVVLALIAGLALLIGRGIRPVAAMTAAMRRLAEGDTDIVIPARGQREPVERCAARVDETLVERLRSGEGRPVRGRRQRPLGQEHGGRVHDDPDQRRGTSVKPGPAHGRTPDPDHAWRSEAACRSRLTAAGPTGPWPSRR